MCSAPNAYMFVYILIGTHMVPLRPGPICVNNMSVTMPYSPRSCEISDQLYLVNST